MPSKGFSTILQDRCATRQDGLLHAETTLKHFSLINYALPKERLTPYIPEDRFKIPEFMIGGRPMALMSAVVFYDVDFRFVHLLPFMRDRFGQTNYRVYVIDRKTGEHCAWFFGTTLGSFVVHMISALWKIPWHRGHYRMDCRYDEAARRYERYVYSVRSDWAPAELDVEDTGEPLAALEGFASVDEMACIVTHPAEGYMYLNDGPVGTYSVWHERIPLTLGRPRHLYFGLYERLGLLTREEMLHPHSIFLCPSTDFRIYLPPRRVPL